jgi:transcription elongation factor Elf1
MLFLWNFTMALFIDLKYTHLLSSRLDKFVTKGEYLFNFRCPLCGDSQSNQSKKRGFIFRRTTSLIFKCHNCGQSLSLGNLIKEVDNNLYNEYVLEKYKSGETPSKNINTPIEIPAIKFGKDEKRKLYENAEWCDVLPEQHFCRLYLRNRKLPDFVYKHLLFTTNYKKFVDEVYPDHDKELEEDARVVIPFYDTNDNLIAISGRALESGLKKLRYITLRTNESEDKLIYGLDRINFNKPVMIVEGQFDSFFLNNCIAACNSDLLGTSERIKKDHKIKTVLIYDNEPRNREIIRAMRKAIKKHENIVIWPDNVDGKDINEMIINGMPISEINEIIDKNTVSDLKAMTRFTYWKKSND